MNITVGFDSDCAFVVNSDGIVRAWGGGGTGPLGSSQKKNHAQMRPHQIARHQQKAAMFFPPIPVPPTSVARASTNTNCCVPRVVESLAGEGVVRVSHAKAEGHVVALTDAGEVSNFPHPPPFPLSFSLSLFPHHHTPSPNLTYVCSRIDADT
jgi:hypothetical protein